GSSGMFAQQPAIDPNTGTMTFRTASNRNGTAVYDVRVRDSGSGTLPNVNLGPPHPLTITITPVNDAPGANDDVASVLTNNNSNTINVLANDLAGPPDEQTGGANAQTLKVLTKTNGAHGTVTITNGGALVDYVPAANFTGSDTFTYTVCDAATCPPGLTSAPATVFVTVTPSVTRLAGSDRYATGVAITRNFSGNGPVVYVATGANFPDALAGAAAAGHFDAPLVLLPGTASSIPTIVQDELTRLAPAKIVVLGSSGAINDTIFAQLHSYAATVVRVFGSSRYETAIAISQDTYPTPAVSPPVHLVQEVWIATGRNFPDALAAAAVAGRDDAPLLLVDGLATGLTGTANAAVKTELQRLNPVTVRIAGSAGVVSQGIQNALNTMFGSGNVHRYGGSNRYQTATLISGAMFAHPLAPGATMYVATGVNFPDALAGAALAGHEGAPLLLVPGTSSSINGYPSIGQELTALKPARIIIFGSSGAVSTGIFNQLVGYTGL
ncbi:MAG: cell wall-binding repeat-containing protein, partial [Candidatus Limnocylindrales bacterium]